MDFLQTLLERNAAFAANGFSAELKIIPSQRALIIGCVDPRVDPVDVLGLQPGEAAVIRNVGGRVTPALFETLAILGRVSQAGGAAIGEGWHLIILQHTDCGIRGCLHHAPSLLAQYMGVAPEQLPALAIADPRQAVAIDVAALKANPQLPAGFSVSGMVYDVATGLVETVVPASRLRP
jgi:carbonic anhydrase